MFRQSTCAACLIVASLCIESAAADGVPTFSKGTSYASARSSLITLGWKPAKTPDAQPCGGDSRCVGRPEIEACAGTGVGSCLFTWRRSDTLIAVSTVGGGEPTVSGIKCRAGCSKASAPSGENGVLSAQYCRSPQGARAVVAQANRDHVLQPPLIATKAEFVGHDRIRGADMCQFSLSTRSGETYTFATTRGADGSLRLQFAD
ncbi:hypothetical protein [Methylobacterium sp. P5_C11]